MFLTHASSASMFYLLCAIGFTTLAYINGSNSGLKTVLVEGKQQNNCSESSVEMTQPSVHFGVELGRKDKGRKCPTCSLTILNLSWCLAKVPNKHSLNSDNVACCFHPAVVARNTEGMKCKCCKLGVGEHCRTEKACCYKPKRDGC